MITAMWSLHSQLILSCPVSWEASLLWPRWWLCTIIPFSGLLNETPNLWQHLSLTYATLSPFIGQMMPSDARTNMMTQVIPSTSRGMVCMASCTQLDQCGWQTIVAVCSYYIGYSVMGVSNCWTEIWNGMVEWMEWNGHCKCTQWPLTRVGEL